MSAPHIFDRDGTLLRDSTAGLEISRHLDGLVPLEYLEHRFAAGEITAAAFAVADHAQIKAPLRPMGGLNSSALPA